MSYYDARRVAFDDQVRAAEADADDILALGDNPGPTHEGPHWLTDRLAEVVGTGPFRRCEHLTSPKVAFAGSWAPGRIVCWDCLDFEVASARESCDLCNPPAPCTGTFPVTSGALVILVATCDSCAAAVDREAP